MTAGGNNFKNATTHKVNSYYTLAISYCAFCVGKHTILGPENSYHSKLVHHYETTATLRH